MNSKESLGALGVMYVVKNKRNEVISLLLKNGVVAPSNATDLQLGLLVTNLLKVSKSFYNEFSALMLNKDTVEGLSSNMSGSYKNADGIGYTFGSSASTAGLGSSNSNLGFDTTIFSTPKTTTNSTTTAPKTESTSSTSPSWLNTGLGLLQTGFQGYLQLDDNKTKRELANASVQISQPQTSGAELPTKTGMSTGAIVGLSLLGLSVVGGIIYLIVKKK